MKKGMIAFILFFTFMFSWPVIGLATENSNTLNNNTTVTEQVQNNVVEKPQEPVIDDSATVEENNQKIDTYNEQVDTYNNYVAEENSRREEEYNKACEDVNSHNESEQQKVEQNKADLEKQEKRDAKIVEESQSQTAGSTDNGNDIPTTWEKNTDNPITISVDKKESTSTYKIINLHVYVDENTSDTYTSSSIDENGFHINVNPENIILSEWETVEVGNNDIVTLYSQAKNYKNSGALFLRRLEGYTNGYWIPTQEFTSNSKNVIDDWDDNGPSTIVSYDEGTTDRQSIKNILNVFVYNFLRYGAEPARVTEYTPDIWNYPEPVVYLETLNKLDRLTEQPPLPESGETSKTEEPPKEPKPSKEKPEPSKEEPKQNSETTVIPESAPVITPEKTTNNLPENKVEKTIITQDKEDTKSIISKVEDTINSQKTEEPSAERIVETQTIIREIPTVSVIENTRGYSYPVYKTITNNTEKEIERVESADTATPADLASKETQLSNNETPLANGEKKKEEHWALINLIAMIITILSAIKIPKKDKQKEDDENAE